MDGREASSFACGINGKATDADRLDGKDSTAFVGATRPMSVVAAGSIAPDGSIREATSNVTVQKVATGLYHINIAGVFCDSGEFVGMATAISDNQVVTTGTIGGNLVVETDKLSGGAADGFFSFVVYDAG